ncbi:MAG: hypothetical protein WA814_07470 [Candidatus Baltobacteraceae bacterium]
MLRTTALAFVVLVAGSMAAASASTCGGPDPAVTSAHLKSVTSSSGLNHYTIVGTVTNLGSAQAATTLQFVNISQYGNKLDSRGIPPLGAGQSYAFMYVWPRSTDAGAKTSILDLTLDVQQGAAADCDRANDTYSLTI